MKWVTRSNVKVDRVACPWLIRRFIDPASEFLFVPEDQLLETAHREGAIPFDANRFSEINSITEGNAVRSKPFSRISNLLTRRFIVWR